MSGTINRITSGATINRTTSGTTVSRVTGATTLTLGSAPPLGRVRYLSTFEGTDPTGATDCADEITAAIATTAAAGQVLIIDGTYLCSEKVTLASGASLMGLGWDQSVLTFDWSTQTPDNSYVYGTGLTDVSITNLQITGDGDGTPWGSTAQSGAVVAGFRIIDSTGVRIESCRLVNVPGLNIILNDVQRATVAHNHITGAGRDGIHITGQGTAVSEDITVEGNVIHTVGDDAIALNAGTSANGTSVTVSTTAGSTTVTGSGTTWVAGDVGKRIAIETADNGAMFEAVIATRVSNTEITVDRKVPTTTASVSGSYGFARATGIRIIGNTIYGQAAVDTLAAGRGIYVAGADSPVIADNQIRSTHGCGIEFDDDENVPYIYTLTPTVTGNVIIDAGQVWGGVNSASLHGLRIYACIGGVFSDNVITTPAQGGIYCARTTDAVIESNVITGAGESAGDCGIQIDGVSGERRAQRNKVANNVVRRSYVAGIRINYASLSTVIGNTCTDNGRNGALDTEDCGIVVRGDGTWQILGNHCYDTRDSGARTQRLGILIGNDGGSPTLHLRDNVCVNNNTAPGISILNTTATVYQSGNHSSATDASASFEQWDTVKLVRGTGSPESVVTAGVGSLYLRTDGGTDTTLYVKESGTGSTGWAAI